MSLTLTFVLTIMGGALTFSLGQFILKAVLEPFLELKREIGEIAHDLDFYANQMYGDKLLGDEAREKSRRHACHLTEKITTILWYSQFYRILQLPPRNDIKMASARLISYSNRSRNPQPGEFATAEEIKKLLKIGTG